jgi:hypothetical protein
MHFSQASCHFIPLRSKYYSKHPLLKHPQSVCDVVSIRLNICTFLRWADPPAKVPYSLYRYYTRPQKLVLEGRVALGGLVVSVLATGPKVRGFKPGRGR